MNANELCKKYISSFNEQAKNTLIKSVIIKDCYIDYFDKLHLCSEILNMTDGNKPLEYYLWTGLMIKLYTNIEYSFLDYDCLDKHKLIEVIIDNIDKREIVTFKSIFDMLSEKGVDKNHVQNN